MKQKFVCSTCEFTCPYWLPVCTQCGGNGTMRNTEFPEIPSEVVGNKLTPIRLGDVTSEEQRFQVGIPAVDKLLGGGLVTPSITVLSGPPGIGKSTLMLQMCDSLLKTGKKILYAAGEEAPSQIANRARRLNTSLDLGILSSTTLEDVLETCKEVKPDFFIIDSIQTVYSPKSSGEMGGVSQIKNAARVLLNFTKKVNVAILVICHVTKEGSMAGPKALEHFVDTTVHFEREKEGERLLLRINNKHRFGKTYVETAFYMTEHGLVSDA